MRFERPAQYRRDMPCDARDLSKAAGRRLPQSADIVNHIRLPPTDCRSALLHSGATWRVPCWNGACTVQNLWATWIDQPRRTTKITARQSGEGQECQSDEVC